MKIAEEVRELLKEQGYHCTLINARFVKEFDKELIQELAADHKLLVTMEENVTTGGFGERVSDFVQSNHIDLEVEKEVQSKEHQAGDNRSEASSLHSGVDQRHQPAQHCA